MPSDPCFGLYSICPPLSSHRRRSYDITKDAVPVVHWKVRRFLCTVATWEYRLKQELRMVSIIRSPLLESNQISRRASGASFRPRSEWEYTVFNPERPFLSSQDHGSGTGWKDLAVQVKQKVVDTRGCCYLSIATEILLLLTFLLLKFDTDYM